MTNCCVYDTGKIDDIILCHVHNYQIPLFTYFSTNTYWIAHG